MLDGVCLIAGLIKSNPLHSWRETLAAIFTHSNDSEVQDLCDALARHLLHNGQVHAAILSWICAGNVDSTVRAWTKTLQTPGSGVSSLQAGFSLQKKSSRHQDLPIFGWSNPCWCYCHNLISWVIPSLFYREKTMLRESSKIVLRLKSKERTTEIQRIVCL